jgi:hypothetical protein
MKKTIFQRVKKQTILAILFAVFLISVGGIVLAQTGCPTEGLVPCGTEGCPCKFCHFFVMFDRIVDFVLFKLVPPIAVLMLLIGGAMFIFGGGSPAIVTKGKNIMTSVAIGLIIIFVAYLVIGLFLHMIGLNDWTTDIYRSWWERGVFEFKCE